MTLVVKKHQDPEYYFTTGCKFSPSCFDSNKESICPFPQCIEDKGGVRAAQKALQKQEALKLQRQGLDIDAIMAMLDVSKSQIYRLLSGNGNVAQNNTRNTLTK